MYDEPPAQVPLTLCAEVGDATATLSSLSVWGYTVVIVLLALAALALFVRNVRLARRARATRRGTAELRPGVAVLEGEVDHPYDPPLRVEINQTGTQSVHEQGPGLYHWTELSRSVHATPFRLKLPSEQVVQVHPDDRVQLLIEMDRTEQESERARRRIAEVRDGDRIHVSGWLAVRAAPDRATGGYRDAPAERRFSLHPAAGGMLVSRQPLAGVFLRPLRHYAGALLLLALALTAVHGLFAGYHVRTRSATVVGGDVVDKRVEVDSEDNNARRLVLEVRLPDGGSLQADVSGACYERVGKGDRVPVLVSPRAPGMWQIGYEPSVNLGLVLVGFVVVVVALLGWLLILRASRKWYGGRLLDETSAGPPDSSARQD